MENDQKPVLSEDMASFVKFARSYSSPKDPKEAYQLWLKRTEMFKVHDLFLRVTAHGKPTGGNATVYMLARIPITHVKSIGKKPLLKVDTDYSGLNEVWPNLKVEEIDTTPYFMVMINITTRKSARAIDMGSHPYIHSQSEFSYKEVVKATAYRPNEKAKPIHLLRIGNLDDLIGGYTLGGLTMTALKEK